MTTQRTFERFDQITYQRPDYDAFVTEWDKLLVQFRTATSAEEQSLLLETMNRLRIELDTAATIVSIRHSCDTSDQFYAEEQRYMDTVRPHR